MEQFLLGSRGFYGFGLWEVEMLWVRVMGVTLVKLLVELDILVFHLFSLRLEDCDSYTEITFFEVKTRHR